VADSDGPTLRGGHRLGCPHVTIVEAVLGGRAQQRDVHAELGGDDQRRVGDRGVERLGVVGPGQGQVLAVERAEVLLHRQRERQLLTRVGDRLHVDDGDGRVAGERGDDGVLAVDLPALELGERAHGDRVDVARQDPRDLPHVLLGLAVHHDVVVELDRPGALARLEHDRLAAELMHAELEAGAGPQRRVEEQQGDRLAGEGLGVRPGLEAPRRGEQGLDLGACVVEGREEVAHAFPLNTGRAAARAQSGGRAGERGRPSSRGRPGSGARPLSFAGETR
jgi:hypothetical protein